ncbi:hypothetical protein NW752_008006 [Fusarium irregulare]|nr:hypothetical protein NW752_008006 [Fusarium irregulare]
MSSPLVTRRNGKKQACEPCRRRKVACDHTYPVCRRCSRRPNGAANCYYASPTQETAGETSRSQGSAPTAIASSSQPLSSRQLGPDDRLWSSPAARAPDGFFGPASFTAAYLETETSLAAGDPSVPERVPTPTPPSIAEIHNMVNMDQGANNLATRILQAIPEQPPSEDRWSGLNCDDWVRIVGKKLIESTWDTFGSYLRNRSRLHELGSMVCINTRKTLTEDQEDPQSWIAGFSGSNLRWEALGIMFLYVALNEVSNTMSQDSRRMLEEYTEYVSSCITLANMGGSSGSLMLYLLYKRSFLHACMHGETSLPFWKFHAETVAMLTFAGRHDNCSKNLRGPTYTTIPCEILRRFSCQVFITDKFLATLVGRPPLLSRRFCSVELPLDIDDVTLLTDKESFDRCRESLDLDGWATDGRFRAVTVLRIRMKIALIRDRILEFVMGHNCAHDNRDFLSIREEEEKLYRELPIHFLYNPADGMQNMDTEGAHQKLLVGLDHLLNMFLIERLLVKRDPTSNRKDLLVISFEMVVLTLSIWTQRHIWAEVKGENQWTIRSYATLAGAILCMELINPNPVEGINATIAGETYSRSSVIQQLSLLAGSLGSSQSSTSVKVRAVIKKVLDHILNDPRGPPTPVGLEGFDFNADWDIFTQLDNMDWLMD